MNEALVISSEGDIGVPLVQYLARVNLVCRRVKERLGLLDRAMAN
jgi:hypothetical protein